MAARRARPKADDLISTPEKKGKRKGGDEAEREGQTTAHQSAAV